MYFDIMLFLFYLFWVGVCGLKSSRSQIFANILCLRWQIFAIYFCLFLKQDPRTMNFLCKSFIEYLWKKPIIENLILEQRKNAQYNKKILCSSTVVTRLWALICLFVCNNRFSLKEIYLRVENCSEEKRKTKVSVSSKTTVNIV